MFIQEKNKPRNIYLKPGKTDMRKAINGLSIIVQEEFELDPFCGNYFAFCNRTRTLIKILYWDLNGFCLWQKRLEQDKFPWPQNGEEAVLLTDQQINWLLSGINFFNAHQGIVPTIVENG